MDYSTDIRWRFGQVVTTVREYVEEQMQLGFLELEENENQLRERTSSYADLDLTGLRELAVACEKCELSKTRTHVVFGTGNEQADLMFVGEAPGADEDQQGQPFVGRAGQLLT